MKTMLELWAIHTFFENILVHFAFEKKVFGWDVKKVLKIMLFFRSSQHLKFRFNIILTKLILIDALYAWGESCGPHDSPYVVRFFCQPPYYALWNHLHLFGSFVQTMSKLCCAHLISSHPRQAQMYRDIASNHEIDFFLHNIGKF